MVALLKANVDKAKTFCRLSTSGYWAHQKIISFPCPIEGLSFQQLYDEFIRDFVENYSDKLTNQHIEENAFLRWSM